MSAPLSDLRRGALYELLVRLAKELEAPAVDFARVRAILREYERLG